VKELAAGGFSAWVTDTRRAQTTDADADVPCNGCTACCRSSFFVHIEPDEIATLRRIPRELVFAAPGRPKGHVVLGYDEHGHCPMLVDDKCSIYADRPRTCRKFDCRVLAAAGLDADAAGQGPLADQARRWTFDYPTARDRAEHEAVRAAAAFLAAHPECFAPAPPPSTSVQRSVVALAVHDVFIGTDAPDVDTVRAALRRTAPG
jgi:hypothetical protein